MLLDHKELKAVLDGMYWDHGDFAVKMISSDKNAIPRAITEFKRSLPAFCTNTCAIFEDIDLNVVQTEMILRSVTPVGIAKSHVDIISRMGQTASRMCELIENNEFKCSYEALELIHQCLSLEKESALCVKEALDFLQTNVKDQKELAAAVFLYLCKKNIFKDFNGISALFIMNGILINAGFFPFMIKSRDKAEFKIRFKEFMCSCKASDMMHFLVMTHERKFVRHEKFSKLKVKSKTGLTFF
ncbi:MAG: hypothetical protein Q4E81_08100 [Succinatimonas sp.]|nr:hypothetical protein [Succinatimonas sp.]